MSCIFEIVIPLKPIISVYVGLIVFVKVLQTVDFVECIPVVG